MVGLPGEGDKPLKAPKIGIKTSGGGQVPPLPNWPLGRPWHDYEMTRILDVKNWVFECTLNCIIKEYTHFG